ncbi:hypothetical protein ACIRBX_24865 [Kitasatospora sp. NPDC096147]|uniref:hypothetical protein n=1 Tax=Kitasatospora sp. NPDC096147 TaxID=3364093 RepID=UPI00380CEC58
MRALHRVLVAGALSLPLALGTAAAASAHDVPSVGFEKGGFMVGPGGAGVQLTEAHFGPDGACYFDGMVLVGPGGVSGGFTDSSVDWTG